MRKFIINVNGNSYEVEVEEVGGAATSAPVARAAAPTQAPKATPQAAPKASTPPPTGAKNVVAPMPGNIIAVKVNVGDTVKSGDVLCV
ncbi:MAG: biotin/lipoyl-containing protein, partial [Oscillospiraceae bacterium]